VCLCVGSVYLCGAKGLMMRSVYGSEIDCVCEVARAPDIPSCLAARAHINADTFVVGDRT